MSLIPYDPFRHVSNVRRELERLFSGFPFDMNMGHCAFDMTRVDIHETANEVIAICDIPGFEKKEDLKIHIENNLLSIHGVVNKTNEVEGQNMYQKEQYTSSFHRTVALPTSVSNEGVRVSYKNGILEVRMTKLPPHNNFDMDADFR